MNASEDDLKVLPLEEASALAAAYYVDPEVAAVERERVFSRSWQLVARSGDLTAAGDHVVCEIAGTPLIIVRGADGVLRALHNVCRHRAGPLATENGRGAKTLRCRYHGWTYALDGGLRAAPEMSEARDFDVSVVSLTSARVHEWQGLLSGGYVPGRLSPKRGAGVWHFQNLLRRAYAGS